ncbi:MAG: Ig-like domain-containing protein, partial [Bacillota bacterium]|nr:Ig-like domain-containing protein [Bacillota bacterium]
MGVRQKGSTYPRNKLLVQASLAVLVVILIFCAAGDVGLAKLRIFPALVELPIGASVSLHVSDASGTVRNSELQWVSDNPQIVTVSPGGYITALSVGETSAEVFSVRDSSQRAFCRVVVVEAGPTLLYPTDRPPTPPDAPDFPPNTPDAPPDQPPDMAGDDEIPVEHDSDLDLPVERLPEIDEFIWTIRVHDSITQDAS